MASLTVWGERFGNVSFCLAGALPRVKASGADAAAPPFRGWKAGVR